MGLILLATSDDGYVVDADGARNDTEDAHRDCPDL